MSSLLGGGIMMTLLALVPLAGGLDALRSTETSRSARAGEQLKLVAQRTRITVQPGGSARFDITATAPLGGAAAVQLRSGETTDGIRTRVEEASEPLYWRVTVSTSADTPVGVRRVALVGRRAGDVARLTLTVTVMNYRSNRFSIVGSVTAPLAPGQRTPIAMMLGNMHADDLRIDRLRARVTSVTAPQATRAHPCGLRDFRARGLRSARRSVVPQQSRRSLGELGYAVSEWPSVELVDRPVNQDGCKGATVTLAYRGTGFAR